MLHLLLFNESSLHYLSIMCVTMMVFCVCVNAPSIYCYILLLVVKLLVKSFHSSCGFLFYHLHYYGGCQNVKKQILIAVCVVEFSGLHSDFPVCKLQFCSVNVFTVLL